MVGSGCDTGKCTIEVDVDGAAEVAVSGDSGRLRTLSGQTAVWRRFESSGNFREILPIFASAEEMVVDELTL
jgi:hypothetical protein